MSKAVLYEDTDEEYIEIALKKKEKKPVKYMDTLRADGVVGVVGVERPATAPVERVAAPPVVSQPAVAQKKVNSFLKF